MIQKVFKESFLYTLANHAPLLVNIIILPIISPFLTPNDYGVYGLILAYTGILSAFAHLGFITLFQNAFYKERDGFEKKWNLYFGFLLIWKVLYGAIVIILLWYVFYKKLSFNEHILMLFLVIVPLIGFDLSKILGLKLCQYTNKHKKVYTITFITSIVSIATTFIGVYHFKLGYKAWLISSFLNNLIQFIYYSHYLYSNYRIRPMFNFSSNFIKNSLKESLPLIPHFYSTYLLEASDRVILDRFNMPISDIGKYNLAYSFSNYFKSFNDSMNSVVSPLYFNIISKNQEDGAHKIKSLTLLWFYFILSISFFLALWTKEIFQFLYRNEGLYEGYYYVIFILIGFTYQPFYSASVIRAIYSGKAKGILKISFTAGVLNILLNLILIPYYGVIAAVFSTFISYIYMGFSGFFIKEIRQYIQESYKIGRLIGLIVITGIVAYLLKEISVVYKVIITIIGIVILLIGWKVEGHKIYSSIKNLTE